MTTTNAPKVLEELPHAWVVECAHTECANRFLAPKRVGTIADYSKPEEVEWVRFDSAAAVQAAGFAATTCALHPPVR